MNFLKNKKRLLFFSYFIVAFLVYGAFLNNPFIMDDEIHILENSHTHQLSDWPLFFLSSSMGSGGAEKMQGIYYKPLLMTYFSAVWHFFEDQPWAYRIGNILFHSTNAGLIFIFSTHFFNLLLSFLIGLFFLLHSANSEVVLYICDAQDSLYFLFGISSLVILQKCQSKARLLLLLSLSLMLSLFSKETGALFIALCVVYSFYFRRDVLKSVFALGCGLSMAYLALRYSIGLVSASSPHLLFHQADYLTRIQTLPIIWAKYVELLFFPWRLSLTADFVVKSIEIFNFYIPLILVIAFLILIIWSRRFFEAKDKRLHYFFCAVFLFWFILHSHVLVPLDGVYADRWLYMATWSFSVFFVVGLSRFLQTNKKIIFFATIILMVFIGRNIIRGMDWSDPLRFYKRELELHPYDATMSNNVGVALFRLSRWQEAKPYFQRAAEFNPSWNVSWNNWGAIEEREQNYSLALELYKRSFTIAGYSLAVENYARLLFKLGRLEECKEHVSWALQHYPLNPLLLELKAQLSK